MTSDCFDVVIVGGGMVGLSLAAALDGSALRVLQVEAQAPVPMAARWDERHFALGRASVKRLRAMGAWDDTMVAGPIREVHVSRSGQFGRVLLCASDMQVDALGYTVPARVLVDALERRVQAMSSMRRMRPARLLRSEPAGDRLRLHIADAAGDHIVETRLLVAADGSESAIRSAAGIGTERHDYGQTAVVCAAEMQNEHHGRAFERFTERGPFALLPLGGRRCGVVCTLDDASAQAALALDDTGFIALLQERFGYRLGKFIRVGKRQPWPLHLIIANRLFDTRMVLIGNAAQAIHPIGAQGFNLGLRDAAALADLIMTTRDDVGRDDLLATYAQSRAADRERTIHASHLLARFSARSAAPVEWLRTVAMAMVDRVPPLRSALARSAMGYRSAAS